MTVLEKKLKGTFQMFEAPWFEETAFLECLNFFALNLKIFLKNFSLYQTNFIHSHKNEANRDIHC